MASTSCVSLLSIYTRSTILIDSLNDDEYYLLENLMLMRYREPRVLLWRGFTLQEFANQLFGNKYDQGKGRQMPIIFFISVAAEYYKSVTRVNQLKDLGKLLKTTNKLLVAIYGKVKSDNPIDCKLSGLRGVIVMETAYQNFLKQNDEGKWIQDSTLMQSTNKEVPWYLDDGSARVHIVGSYPSYSLLKHTGEVFEGPGQSLVHGTCGCVQGPKMLGVTRSEYVLSTDTQLIVVGKAIKDYNGTFTINQPDYVSRENINLDHTVANYRMWACFYKYASIGLATIGCCLIATHAFQFILDKTRHWQFKRRAVDAAAKKETPDDNEGSNDTRKDGQVPVICIMCLDQEYNSVFVPCGHICVTCSSKFTSCPLCQSRIGQVLKTFKP